MRMYVNGTVRRNNGTLLRFIPLALCLISFASLSFKNRVLINDSNSKAVKIRKVLILGNSIVKHGPKSEIGWFGNWGMAASVEDSDYVHLLIRDIHCEDPSVIVRFASIADFERNFTTFPLSNLDSLRNPDMLILKISVNVNDMKADEDNFIFYYDKLVKYISPDPKSIKVIMDGFWDKEKVNKSIKDLVI